MKRLQKIALIGNISKNDINIEVLDNSLQVLLINEEKANDSYNLDTPIASMMWTQEENQVYIDYVVVEEPFRGSTVAMYLLKKFEEVVLEPMVSQYGKDNMTIAAEFENYELAETVKNYCKKKGFNFQDTALMGEELLVNQLKERGADAFIGYNQAVTIKNTPYEILVDEAMNLENIMYQVGFDYCDGYVDSNGDIYIFTHDRGFPPGQKLTFNCSAQSVEFQVEVQNLINSTNTINFINNAKQVFTNQEFDFSDTSMSGQELEDYLTNIQKTASINQKLKKLCKNQ